MAIHPLPVSLRIDAPDSLEQKARLLQLSPAQIQATEQAGDEIEFPCYTAAALLWPEPRIGELSYLLTLLEDWRGRVFRKYKPQ